MVPSGEGIIEQTVKIELSAPVSQEHGPVHRPNVSRLERREQRSDRTPFCRQGPEASSNQKAAARGISTAAPLDAHHPASAANSSSQE